MYTCNFSFFKYLILQYNVQFCDSNIIKIFLWSGKSRGLDLMEKHLTSHSTTPVLKC